jgi:hypothetical protein
MNIDETADLPVVHMEPAQITETTDAVLMEALVTDLADHLAGVRRLIGSRADAGGRAVLREELARLIGDGQQLAGMIADLDAVDDHPAAFADWAKGGEDRD